MRTRSIVLTATLLCLAVFVGGCAKQEIVKKEETIPVTAARKQQITSEAVKEQPLQQVPAKETIAEEPLNPIPQAGELNAVLDTIYFGFDSYLLSSEARAALVKNSGILKEDSGLLVKIEGHCDERGSDEYNLALGEKRARTAMQYLTTIGIPANRLSVISYGKEKPADPGHDEAAWSKNRRDEFIIMKK